MEIGVGLLGLGNVGAGVIKLLEENAPAIEARLGAKPVVRGIAVRMPEKTPRCKRRQKHHHNRCKRARGSP